MTAVQIGADEARALRMASLLLREPASVAGRRDVAGTVSWFGAMQAQDLNSALWSLGVRLPGSTVDGVQQALERREALRTWPMRGTVHLVPAPDARWMLEILGERPLAGAAARRAFLGLDERTVDKAVDILAAALAGGRRLTRSECLSTLAEGGVDPGGQRGYHLLWYASQRGVTCIAPNVGTEQTFVLLDDWVPDAHRPDRDEALGIMALRYFRSHGPTTRQDFAGWIGMTAAAAKRGIAAAGEALATVRVDGKDMLMASALLDAYRADPEAFRADEVHVLPGFDEYMLGFKDRSLMLAEEHKQAIVPGGNGVFQPTVSRGGRVIGTWKRARARNGVAVEVRPLEKVGPADRKRVERALESYARFLGGDLAVTWPAR